MGAVERLSGGWERRKMKGKDEKRLVCGCLKSDTGGI